MRASNYPYTETDPPGANVHRLRLAKNWTLRELADACDPPADHTTIQRLEANSTGYTRDLLNRVAAALGVEVHSLFAPSELQGFYEITPARRLRIAEQIRDAYELEKQEKKHR